jgi:hypothetical protein
MQWLDDVHSEFPFIKIKAWHTRKYYENIQTVAIKCTPRYTKQLLSIKAVVSAAFRSTPKCAAFFFPIDSHILCAT